MRARRILVVAAVLGATLGVIVTRSFWGGITALSRGDDALTAGDSEEAIRHWRRAARWYVPAAPHVGQAYERLEELGQSAEAEGDLRTALAAYTGIRSSILATRSFYTPHADRLEPANRKIALIMAKLEEPRGEDGGDERRRWHHERLAIDEAPSTAWTLLAVFGFVLWLGGAFAFALRGVDGEDRLVPRIAAYAGAAVALGLVVWLWGLYHA